MRTSAVFLSAALGAGLAAATASQSTLDSQDCSSQCTDFNQLIDGCDQGAVTGGDWNCTCNDAFFQALVKCGECMPESYAPYEGGLQGFVQTAVEECTTKNFTVTIETDSLTGSINDTLSKNDTSSVEQLAALAQCGDMCVSVCSLEQAEYYDKECICKQDYFDSQIDCTGCAMAFTNQTGLEELILGQAKSMSLICSSAGYTNLTVPSFIEPVYPTNTTSSNGTSTESADGPGPSGGTGSGESTTWSSGSSDAVSNASLSNNNAVSASSSSKVSGAARDTVSQVGLVLALAVAGGALLLGA